MSELHDMTIVPSCGKCGARMQPKLDGSGVDARARWICPKDKTHVFTAEQLEELRRKRTDMRPSYAILMIKPQRVYLPLPEAHSWKKEEEVTVEEISERNMRFPTYNLGGGIVWGLMLGPIGAAAGGRPYNRTVFDSMDKEQKRMKKDPYSYPYSRLKIDMLCPKCRTKVRADMEHCEQCGTKFVVPIPLCLSR